MKGVDGAAFFIFAKDTEPDREIRQNDYSQIYETLLATRRRPRVAALTANRTL
jgi:hypothetical protein